MAPRPHRDEVSRQPHGAAAQGPHPDATLRQPPLGRVLLLVARGLSTGELVVYFGQ